MTSDRNEPGEDLLGALDEDTQKGKFLTFCIGREDYGIEIRHVTEIIGIQKITQVPDMPDFVQGVINLRGKVIPIMDVRARFRLPSREYDDRTCIVVVNVNSTDVGLVVDKVNEVTEIAESQIQPPPGSTTDSSAYIRGLGKSGDKVKILLDVTRMIYSPELEMFNP